MKSNLQLAATAKEQIQHKVNTNLRCFMNRLHSDFPPHWHTDIEIICPLEAPYKVICSAQTYFVDVGDILIICPAVLHEIFSPTPGARLYIQADFTNNIALRELDNAFRLMTPALHIKKKDSSPNIYAKLYEHIINIKNLYFCYSDKTKISEETVEENDTEFTELEPYRELDIYAELFQLISFCAKNFILLCGAKSSFVKTTCKNSITLSNICAYIAEHFTENISLEDVSAHAGFSKYHFERIFTDYSGMTFYQYLQQMRVNYAQTLLSNPGLSITDVSYQSGFASSAAFARAFKKSTGYAPSEYRMLNESLHPIPQKPHLTNN